VLIYNKKSPFAHEYQCPTNHTFSSADHRHDHHRTPTEERLLQEAVSFLFDLFEDGAGWRGACWAFMMEWWTQDRVLWTLFRVLKGRRSALSWVAFSTEYLAVYASFIDLDWAFECLLAAGESRSVSLGWRRMATRNLGLAEAAARLTNVRSAL
jgi:transposase